VRSALERLLGDATFRVAASRVRDELGRWRAADRFGAFVDAVTGAGPGAGRVEAGPIPAVALS